MINKIEIFIALHSVYEPFSIYTEIQLIICLKISVCYSFLTRCKSSIIYLVPQKKKILKSNFFF